jgi:hypothetical protein
MRNLAAVATLAVLLGGCYLYQGDDDCLYDEGTVNAVDLRNPATGMCEYFETWEGGGDCLPGGDYGDRTDKEAPPERLDWAMCTGRCDGLDEQGCMLTAGCRAAYVSDCPQGYDCTDTNYTFYGCWDVAPSGPVQGGGCGALDAYECSRHDDCSARHFPADGCGTMGDCAPGFVDPEGIGVFETCVDEVQELTGCFEDYECPDGSTCNAEEICLPSPWACKGAVPCDDRCYGYCVPGEVEAGNCYDIVMCNSLPPECPDNTLPGIVDGCWSGYCIALAECEAAPACADLSSEAMCVARAECVPIYMGIDCTCDDNGCVCNELLYKECSAGDSAACSDDSQCPGAQKCCYPCGVPGCENSCMEPAADGECPMFP